MVFVIVRIDIIEPIIYDIINDLLYFFLLAILSLGTISIVIIGRVLIHTNFNDDINILFLLVVSRGNRLSNFSSFIKDILVSKYIIILNDSSIKLI